LSNLILSDIQFRCLFYFLNSIAYNCGLVFFAFFGFRFFLKYKASFLLQL